MIFGRIWVTWRIYSKKVARILSNVLFMYPPFGQNFEAPVPRLLPFFDITITCSDFQVWCCLTTAWNKIALYDSNSLMYKEKAPKQPTHLEVSSWKAPSPCPRANPQRLPTPVSRASSCATAYVVSERDWQSIEGNDRNDPKLVSTFWKVRSHSGPWQGETKSCFQTRHIKLELAMSWFLQNELSLACHYGFHHHRSNMFLQDSTLPMRNPLASILGA